ncbi:MAG: 50S ribosomal protein L32 [Clostridiales bacterium]|jgi:large subunit ribosomal protein L32|nr:50S ribosomal protein L32 [Clostridiales bacterium]
MSICPKGKISKGRRDKRRAQSFTISMPNLTKCPKCGELMKAHRACRACGTYKQKVVLNVE